MAAPIDAGSYKEIMLFLATAGIVVPVFSRLKVSPVLGFIGAGILLGPFGLGRLVPTLPWLDWFTIAQTDQVAHLAEFGVVFLLFAIGLELSWERLRALRRLVFGFGAAQVVLSSAALALVGMWFGLRPGQALLCGIALALSSTAIIVPILATQRRLNSPTGRASFSVLLFQDLAVAPVLFTITAVDTAGSGNLLPAFSLALVQAALALAVIVIAGRLALRPLFKLVGDTSSPELFMAASLLVVLGTALVAATSGLSMALGAFVAGLLLAETEYRRAIEAMLEPFKGLLLSIFFVSVGMGLDLRVVAAAPLAILAATVGLIALKALIVLGLSRVFRLPLRVGVEAGLLLGAGGEFAFVLLGAAVAASLVPSDVGGALVAVATASMIALPLLARLARRAGREVAEQSAPPLRPEPPPSDLEGHVIVAGYGRVGQLVADMLGRHAIRYLAIDSNPALVGAQSGNPAVCYGDCTSAAFLRACGIDSATALVVTLDRPSAVQLVVEAARQLRPDLTIVARARDARHARDLYRLGVNDAVPETIEASLQLSEAVLVDIGVPMGPVIASIHERRDEFRRDLQKAGTAATDRSGADPRRTGVFRSRRTVGKTAAT
ncbi:cation:proton antiporter [Enterovirga sp.]|uniref:cation:proton antiporter domain-containing protein n=1 Tax=Enterovirga sp. TaxID=2026350 RepID=UPI002623A9B9|nr:cation:proton antiporter [Enterovirga sp.]MDB5591343.1 kefB [Enterovirga sp.]